MYSGGPSPFHLPYQTGDIIVGPGDHHIAFVIEGRKIHAKSTHWGVVADPISVPAGAVVVRPTQESTGKNCASRTAQKQYNLPSASTPTRTSFLSTNRSLLCSNLFREGARSLISPQVFGWHIVLWDLFRVNFSHVWVGCIFHAADHFGLEGLPLLD
jgi:hypothetical protein